MRDGGQDGSIRCGLRPVEPREQSINDEARDAHDSLQITGKSLKRFRTRLWLSDAIDDKSSD